jgi:hypothetical protein
MGMRMRKEFGPWKDRVEEMLALVEEESDAIRMPPPPATRLSQRDIDVLRRWGETGAPRGVRVANHLPTASWLNKPTTIVIADEDREQVLGKLVCAGGIEQPLLSSGAHTLKAGTQPPCLASLSDGQDGVAVLLE